MAADAASYVDQGFMRDVIGNNISKNGSTPVLQCVQVKALGGGQGNTERYRVVFSDIRNFVQGMLASQMNYHVSEGRLQRGSFVRLKDWTVNTVKGKQIVIVLDLDVLEELAVQEKIGNPQPLEARADEAAAQPTTLSTNGFYGAKQDPQVKDESKQSQGLASRPSEAHSYIHPIESLSPYGNKWTIKARVTSKSEIKNWHNKNGDGKLFSVNLLDDSGEIKATGFNDQCTMFYDEFTEGSVYYISSPCRVNLAKKQFSNLNNDYELTFENNTKVEKAEVQGDVPQLRFNFTKIGDLSTIEKDAVVDTIGVLREIGETNQITSKSTGKPYEKRELTLVDNTNMSVRLTIWGSSASSFEAPVESIVAFKGVKVSDFGGRSLSLLSSGTISVNPDIDEAHSLSGWYQAQGHTDHFTSHASMAGGSDGAGRSNATKAIGAIKDEQLGMNEKPDYFNVKATIIHIRHENPAYPACSSEGCNKKVLETDEGWRCEACNKTHPSPQWRYVLQIVVADHTGQLKLSLFDESARVVMNMSADELVGLKENDADKPAYQQANGHTYMFRVRAKMEMYNDQAMVRYQVQNCAPLNYPAEAAKLVSLIKLYDEN